MKTLLDFLARKDAKAQRRIEGFLLCLLSIGFLSSCIGVNTNISFNADNSGTISLEYRVNQALLSLGRFDGNEAYPTLPVGRIDFERTIARVPGLSLVSHSTRDEAMDSIITARLRFRDINALLGFLDASGSLAMYGNEQGSQKLTLVLGTGILNRDNTLYELIRDISGSYNISFSFSFPSDASLELLDNQGRANNAASQINPQGRNIMFSMPLEHVLYADNGLIAQIMW